MAGLRLLKGLGSRLLSSRPKVSVGSNRLGTSRKADLLRSITGSGMVGNTISGSPEILRGRAGMGAGSLWGL